MINLERTLIILDRDGVINEDSDDHIRTVDEWVSIPGSIEAIAQLSKAGCTVAVATNQSGVGRNYFTVDTLQAMHRKMIDLVNRAGGSIHSVHYCPHTPDDHCDCRKPKPGLINKIIDEVGKNSVQSSWIVGDSLRDLQAGCSGGCTPALVKTGKGLRTLANGVDMDNVAVFDNLAAFARYILQNDNTSVREAK